MTYLQSDMCLLYMQAVYLQHLLVTIHHLSKIKYIDIDVTVVFGLMCIETNGSWCLKSIYALYREKSDSKSNELKILHIKYC